MNESIFSEASLEDANNGQLFELYMTYRATAYEFLSMFTLRMDGVDYNSSAPWVSKAREDYNGCYIAIQNIANEAVRRNEIMPHTDLAAIISLADVDFSSANDDAPSERGLKLH